MKEYKFNLGDKVEFNDTVYTIMDKVMHNVDKFYELITVDKDPFWVNEKYINLKENKNGR